jgi:gliding motility-associated-like protein
MVYTRHLILILFLSLILVDLYPQETSPDPPVIEVVSVDTATGDVVISWTSDNIQGIEKYVIYEGRVGSDSAADAFDTLDVSVTSYRHQGSEANSRSVSYTVAALYADDTSPLADFHYTIFASAIYDSCDNQIIISWTPYSAWESSLLAYNIHITDINGNYSGVPSLSPDITSYEYKDVEQNSGYCLYIEAENDEFLSSTSNRICLNTDRAYPPSFINADYATVTPDNNIQLKFTFGQNTQLTDFILFYGNSRADIVVPITEFENITSGSVTYIHDVFSVEKKSYYQLAAVDLCPQKNPVLKSNIASNIILQVTEDNYLITLEWDDYMEWLSGVKYYHVYRIINQSEIEKIDSLPFGTNTLTDNVGFLIDNENLIDDKVCYYIEAEENDDNLYGIKGFSQSNRVCISIEPEIFMPNAFTPDNNTHNDRIKPILTFRPKSYLFVIYDRWGSKVFETKNADEYWYGKINGKKNAPPGVYIYYLKITTSADIIIDKKGTITLFYP